MYVKNLTASGTCQRRRAEYSGQEFKHQLRLNVWSQCRAQYEGHIEAQRGDIDWITTEGFREWPEKYELDNITDTTSGFQHRYTHPAIRAPAPNPIRNMPVARLSTISLTPNSFAA